jgi:BASS family bile acid:Na+ symporter
MSSDQFINLITVVTLFEMTVAMGLELKFSEVGDVARDWKLILRAELANFVLQPLATFLVLLIVQPTPMAAVGMILLAACPAAHYAMPFTKLARGSLAAAAGLLVVLAASTVVFAPFVLGILLPRFSTGAPVHVPASHVITTLGLIVLLPLAIGMVIRATRPALADRLQKPANQLSVLLNLAMIASILLVQGHQLEQVRIFGYGAMAVVAAAGVAIGWALGGPHGANRKALAFNTVLRNMGPGLVIATGQFAGTAAAPVIVAATFVNGAVALLTVALWARRPSQDATPQAQT